MTVVPNMGINRYKFFFRMSIDQFRFVLSHIENAINGIDMYFAYPPLCCPGKVSSSKIVHLFLYFVGHNACVIDMDDKFALANPMNIVSFIAEILATCVYGVFVVGPSANEKQII